MKRLHKKALTRFHSIQLDELGTGMVYFIRPTPNMPHRQEAIGKRIVLDFDRDQHLVAIEILDPKITGRFFGEAVERFMSEFHIPKPWIARPYASVKEEAMLQRDREEREALEELSAILSRVEFRSFGSKRKRRDLERRESRRETQEILADRRLTKRLRRALGEADKGRLIRLEEAKKSLGLSDRHAPRPKQTNSEV